jgi:SNF2 family DNA or RNA helicase
MRFRIHHGKSKITEFRDIENMSIVLTTYQTVSADWKEGDQKERSVLFSKHWHRIILDEGKYDHENQPIKSPTR